MGASCTGSYEVTPPGRLHALIAPPAKPTNRSMDSNLRVWAIGESDPASSATIILTGAIGTAPGASRLSTRRGDPGSG
jgi:hypothetical protein